MAINFCHQQFLTRIKTDKVSTDGYEAEKLVSPGNGGFIAESFIRTPVNIICTFACNVDIHRVVVCGRVGAQKSIGFEVFAFHEKRDVTKLGQQQFEWKDSNVCQSLGRALSTDKTTFDFINATFRPREPFKKINPMYRHFSARENKHETRLRSPYPRNLTSASYIIVRVTRTASGSVPCIGWLEVWGQPAASSHAQVIADVFAIYKSIMSPKPAVNIYGTKKEHSADKDDSVSSQNAISIPDDFIDPITQNIMTLPVLLPSGHTVDQTTLDRHEKEEAQWGRSANDPYTGVPFSKTSVTQQNTSLKVRIDHFVLKHGNDINVTNPTLGARKIGIRDTTVSSLTKAIAPQYPPAGSSASEVDDRPPRKKLKTEPASTNKKTVASDLDSMLEEALSGLPSYTTSKSSSSVPKNQTSVPNCSLCKAAVNISLLYKLGCDHYMCRNCLLKTKAKGTEIKCPLCSQITRSSDVIKAHQ